MEKDFKIFEQGWPGDDTVCGWGSKMEHTETVRDMLPRIIQQHEIASINDAGCGDLWWIRHVDLTGVDYIGYDIYHRNTWDGLIKDGWDLRIWNVVTQDMRPCDLIMCRDVFIHLPNEMILQALERFRRQSTYLLATSFVSNGDGEYSFDNETRHQLPNLKHAKLDLRLAPFNLGEPLYCFPEDYPNKNMSLWRLKNE